MRCIAAARSRRRGRSGCGGDAGVDRRDGRGSRPRGGARRRRSRRRRGAPARRARQQKSTSSRKSGSAGSNPPSVVPHVAAHEHAGAARRRGRRATPSCWPWSSSRRSSPVTAVARARDGDAGLDAATSLVAPAAQLRAEDVDAAVAVGRAQQRLERASAPARESSCSSHTQRTVVRPSAVGARRTPVASGRRRPRRRSRCSRGERHDAVDEPGVLGPAQESAVSSVLPVSTATTPVGTARGARAGR